MKKVRALLIAALLVGGFVFLTSKGRWAERILEPVRTASWSGPGSAQSAGLTTDEQNNVDIYKLAHSATVGITSTVYRRDWFFDVVPQQGSGSGFVISDDGKILTNNHVVAGSRELQVNLGDQQYNASILFRDPSNDVALIKISPRKKLPVLKLGNSDGIQVGQKVLAIGNPFGLEGTLTTGIISSLGRNLRDENGHTLEAMIQTDAAINPGNSGGPLLDNHGNVIGINTAIYGPSGGNVGIGFALPINRVTAILNEFDKKGRFARPKLGVQVMYVSGDLAEALELPREGGLLIVDLEQGSAAEEGGLRGPRRTVIVGNYELPVGGDLIMAIDGRPVMDQRDLSRAMNHKRPGETLDLTVFRNGRTTKIKVKLGEAPQTL